MISRKPISFEQAMQRAAALCAKCEQCSPDILKKLTAWGLSRSDADTIIRKLEEMRFLDDERFAKAYAHDKMAFSGWGRMKIVKGLWAKRLPKTLVDDAIDNLDKEEYIGIAKRVIAARARLNPELLSDYEGKTKLLRFAAGRGFELSLASKIINALAGRDE